MDWERERGSWGNWLTKLERVVGELANQVSLEGWTLNSCQSQSVFNRSFYVKCRLLFSVFNVRQKTDTRYSYRPSVCLSLRPSVTRWYCVKTAQPIVKLSSLPGSPMILVFWGPNFSPEFQWEHPNGGVKCKGVGKVAISDQYLAIARKRLKIDGHMLWCVWLALNSLSIHVTFTAIVPGVYPWEAKMC